MNCPGCGAAMEPAGNHNYSRCTHCGGFHFPKETGDGVAVFGEPVGATCPLCKLPLVSALIENETICYCDHCPRFFAETPNFGVIVGKPRALHGPNQNNTETIYPPPLQRA